ncbi:MAG TPA: hypothetical protein VFA81_12550 [Burkholderiales bacterium]|nr:hypothetical protein [Burkholderiales bacterium]
MDRSTLRTLAARISVALLMATLGALSVSVGAEDLRVGTWQLVKRQLPDGTVLTPPKVGGMYSVSPGSIVHHNVFWTTPEGKPASVGGIIKYQMGDQELIGTRLFGAFDDGSGKGVVYAPYGETKRVPVKREGNKISYQHPFDPPFIVIDGDTTTATLEGAFIDTWERVK